MRHWAVSGLEEYPRRFDQKAFRDHDGDFAVAGMLLHGGTVQHGGVEPADDHQIVGIVAFQDRWATTAAAPHAFASTFCSLTSVSICIRTSITDLSALMLTYF